MAGAAAAGYALAAAQVGVPRARLVDRFGPRQVRTCLGSPGTATIISVIPLKAKGIKAAAVGISLGLNSLGETNRPLAADNFKSPEVMPWVCAPNWKTTPNKDVQMLGTTFIRKRQAI